MDSPLLRGAIPTPAQLAAFLWIVSPRYRPGPGGRARRRHLAACRHHFVPLPWPWSWLRKRTFLRRAATAAAILDATRAYLDTAFADAPPPAAPAPGGSGGGGGQIHHTQYFSDAATLAHLLWSDYGIPAERALELPVAQYFQLLRRSARAADPRAPQWNPSDQLLAQLIDQANQPPAATPGATPGATLSDTPPAPAPHL